MKKIELSEIVEQSTKNSTFYGGRMKDQIARVQHIDKKQVFSSLAYESQLAILAANTGAGKSVLLVQIGMQIASGTESEFATAVEKQPVIYIDCENDDEDWADRMNGFVVPDNLFRYGMDSEAILRDVESELIQGMKEKMLLHNAKVFLIDNLKWMMPPGSDERLASWKLIRSLNNFRQQHNCVIFLATHSNKDKNSGIWTLKDIAGSSDITRFAQSVFVLGDIDGKKDQKYIKQLKQRFSSMEYDEDNVMVGALVKEPEKPLRFNWIGCGHNENNLVKGELGGRSKAQRIKEEYEANPDQSAEDIAKKVGCSAKWVKDTLKG